LIIYFDVKKNPIFAVKQVYALPSLSFCCNHQRFFSKYFGAKL